MLVLQQPCRREVFPFSVCLTFKLSLSCATAGALWIHKPLVVKIWNISPCSVSQTTEEPARWRDRQMQDRSQWSPAGCATSDGKWPTYWQLLPRYSNLPARNPVQIYLQHCLVAWASQRYQGLSEVKMIFMVSPSPPVLLLSSIGRN